MIAWDDKLWIYTGSVSSNVRHFDFKRITRPMYPLDLEMSWQPY